MYYLFLFIYFFSKEPVGDPFKERKNFLKIPDLTLLTEARKKELFKSKLMRKILKVLIHSTLNNAFLLVTQSLSSTAWGISEAFTFILYEIIRDCAFA